MDIRRTRTCERCKSVVPLERIRLVPKNNDQNILICDNCMTDLKSTPNSKITNSQSRIYMDAPKEKISNQSRFGTSSQRIIPLPAPDYSKYTCTKCSYVFRVDRVKAGITYGVKCPYCGRSDKLRLYKEE
jgi:ribosomal protein L37AE/L43A